LGVQPDPPVTPPSNGDHRHVRGGRTDGLFLDEVPHKQCPDIKGFAAANRHDGKSDDEIRTAMGDKFPKHIYLIICIGALVSGA
jgi:hypothetical protein